MYEYLTDKFFFTDENTKINDASVIRHLRSKTMKDLDEKSGRMVKLI